MPRFFFNIVDGTSVPDTDGSELPDLASARHAATDILAEQLRGSRENFWQMKQWRLEIAGTDGKVLAVLTVTAESTI